MNDHWINGAFVRDDQAQLKISDLAIQRGYGVFDFFKVRDGHPLLLTHYLDRFYQSAAGLHLQVPLKREQMTGAIYELLERNRVSDCGIKLLLTGGYSGDGYTPSKANLIISQHTIHPPGKDLYQRGYKVMTREYRRELPFVKSINYLQGIYLLPELQKRSLDDVLYHFQGQVSEFPRSNFFMVDLNQRVITPRKHVLAGITRKCILALAAEHWEVEVRDIHIEELERAREAFLTSTTKGVMPVCEIDGQPVHHGQPGPVTQKLHQLLIEGYRQHDRLLVALEP